MWKRISCIVIGTALVTFSGCAELEKRGFSMDRAVGVNDPVREDTANALIDSVSGTANLIWPGAGTVGGPLALFLLAEYRKRKRAQGAIVEIDSHSGTPLARQQIRSAESIRALSEAGVKQPPSSES